MDTPANLEHFYYVEIRTRQIPGRGREWVIGLQAKRGDKIKRVSDTDFERAMQEAMALSEGCGGGDEPLSRPCAPARIT